MSLNLARAVTARSVVSCLVGLFLLTGCSNGGQVTLARPRPLGHTTQGLSTGYAGTATFDVPVADPSTWQGTPIGTGTWSTSATPPLSGGPAGIGFYETQMGRTGHYLMVGNFAASGTFFGIISDGAALTVGTSSVSATLHAGVFDSATGDPVAMAISGTVTLTAAGVIGGRITGSFTGVLDDVTSTGCTSSAQCLSNETCISGTCIATGCTSNAQCGAGRVCQAGQCVNAPPACTSNAQCAAGLVCQGGQCVVGTVVSCNGRQGDGSYTGNLGSLAVCSAFGGGLVSVTKAFATIGDDGNGLRLFVMDVAHDSAGAIIPLSSCPSAPGTVSVSNATYWDQTSSGGVTFYAARPATSATVTYNQVGAVLKGSFWMSLVGGGQLRGDFDIH